MTKKILPLILVSFFILSPSFAGRRLDSFLRPLDYVFKNGLNLRTNHVGEAEHGIKLIFGPAIEIGKLTGEGLQAATSGISKLIGKIIPVHF